MSPAAWIKLNQLYGMGACKHLQISHNVVESFNLRTRTFCSTLNIFPSAVQHLQLGNAKLFTFVFWYMTRMTQQDYCNPWCCNWCWFDGFCVKWEGIVQLGAWYLIKGKYMCQNNDINFIAMLGTTWSCDRWHRHLLVTNWGGHLAWRPMPGALHPQDVLSTLVAILPSFQNINFRFKNDFGTRFKPYSNTPNCSTRITWFPGAAMSWWMHWFSHVDRGLRFETVQTEQNRCRPQTEPGKTSNVNIYETYMKDLSWHCHNFVMTSKFFPAGGAWHDCLFKHAFQHATYPCSDAVLALEWNCWHKSSNGMFALHESGQDALQFHKI